MDARHLMSPEFWGHTIPAFFVNPSKTNLPVLNKKTRFAQVPQSFPIVKTSEDHFDRYEIENNQNWNAKNNNEIN